MGTDTPETPMDSLDPGGSVLPRCWLGPVRLGSDFHERAGGNRAGYRPVRERQRRRVGSAARPGVLRGKK